MAPAALPARGCAAKALAGARLGSKTPRAEIACQWGSCKEAAEREHSVRESGGKGVRKEGREQLSSARNCRRRSWQTGRSSLGSVTDRTFRGLSQAVYILIGTCHLPLAASWPLAARCHAALERACEKSQLANLLIKIIEFRTRFIKRARSAAANQAGLLATCHTVATTCHLPQSELQLQLQFAVIASQPACNELQVAAKRC